MFQSHIYLFQAFVLLGLGGCTTFVQSTVSLQDLSCQSCGAAVVQKLSKEEGIQRADFNRKLAEVSVVHEEETWAGETLVKAIHGYGYGAAPGEGQGNYIPFPEYPEASDVKWLSRAGERFDEESVAVPGKVTVLDFYAPWCGPCREVDRFLIYQLTKGAQFAVRKVNVLDWDSEVAGQLGERLESLPMVKVYGPDGAVIETITGLDLESLKKILKTEEKGP